MAEKVKKKKEITGHLKVANFSSIAIVIFLSAAFVIEVFLSGEVIDVFHGLLILAALIIVISVIKTSPNYNKLAFNIPAVLTTFYTILMISSGWRVTHYFLV